MKSSKTNLKYWWYSTLTDNFQKFYLKSSFPSLKKKKKKKNCFWHCSTFFLFRKLTVLKLWDVVSKHLSKQPKLKTTNWPITLVNWFLINSLVTERRCCLRQQAVNFQIGNSRWHGNGLLNGIDLVLRFLCKHLSKFVLF